MADWQGYLATRELVGRIGPFLIWPSVVAAWVAVMLSLRPAGSPDVAWLRPSRLVALCLGLLTASFILIAWYHWRIYQLLPLELPPDVGAWLNDKLSSGRGAHLPPVDWSRPPRYALPLWIEGEKFWFWSLTMAFIVWIEELRRTHRGYLTTLRVMLALQVTGMALWAGPFPALPQFHAEVLPWFTGGIGERVGHFFKLYPRMTYYYNAAYMWLHPPMLFIAYATLAGTFAASIFTFRVYDPQLDHSAYDYAKIGYLLLTLGMLVGYPWAIVAWGPNWWWDPKIAASIMMWLLYSAYLHHRFVLGSRGGRWQTAALGVLCYASLLFTYFMSWYFPGEHTF